jgi:N-acetyl-alpha-D-muramate 1-phosphate uridylyltransferase
MIRPRVGMVLAAGRGERLRPITDTLPKPLVRIAGRTLLDHAIDRLEGAGIERVIVNVHYLGDIIAEHLAKRASPEIVISREAAALETGGGVKHALALLGDEPFFVVNGDSLWLDGIRPALIRLADAWDPATTDAMLLLQRTATAVGYGEGLGDYMLDQLGRPRRRHAREVAPYLFAGVQLLAPSLFQDMPDGVFSLNRIYDKAEKAGRLGALVHDGEWYHVSTPDGLKLVERRLHSRRVER